MSDAARPPLDHDAYRRWRLIEQPRLAPDGQSLLYVLAGPDTSRVLHIHDLGRGSHHTISDVLSAAYACGSRSVVYLTGNPDDASAAPRLHVIDVTSAKAQPLCAATDFDVSADGEVVLATPPDGGGLFWIDLPTGHQRYLRGAADYAFAPTGAALCYTIPTGARAGLWRLGGSGAQRAYRLHKGPGCGAPVFGATRDHLAYLVQPSSGGGLEVWTWDPGEQARQRIAADDSRLRVGWQVAAGDLSLATDAGRLFLTTQPRPLPPPDHDLDVALDVWHWREPELMSEQIHDLELEPPAYVAVLHLDDETLVQIADPEIPEATIDDPAADTVLGTTSQPYAIESSWTAPTPADYWAIDVRSGARTRLLTNISGDAYLRPDGEVLAAWDGAARRWVAVRTVDADPVARDLSSMLDVAFYDELFDRPGPPPAYGFGGWAPDGALTVYDRCDLWSLDPGGLNPTCLTGGCGRQTGVRLRLLPGEPPVAPAGAELFLSGFNESTRGSSVLAMRAGGRPVELLNVDRSLGLIAFEPHNDRALFTLQSVEHFPDLWVADARFAQLQRISDANPQQADYNWATAELVGWTSELGDELQGVLYKPQNYEEGRQYPLAVFLYERFSDQIHHHFTPLPGPPPVIVPTVYASRGYMVLVPDVAYRDGHPGNSMIAAVRPAIERLVERGMVDPTRIGASSHSWGGYEVAYLAAHTDLLTIAAAGAPVADMSSGYLGIRSGDGESRMYEYEAAQSRIGASLWQAPELFAENSVVPDASEVEAPMLILHNEDDTAVPFAEGRGLFLALRRLGKPAWLVSYAGEPHQLTKIANQLDWSLRLQQFFDHYLKGAAAPEWLAHGIPAVQRGHTLGLDLVGDGEAGDDAGAEPEQA